MSTSPLQATGLTEIVRPDAHDRRDRIFMIIGGVLILVLGGMLAVVPFIS